MPSGAGTEKQRCWPGTPASAICARSLPRPDIYDVIKDDVQLNTPVDEILIEDDAITGVRLASGEVLDAENWAKFDILKRNLIDDIEIVQMIYGNQLDNGTAYNYDAELRPKLFKRQRTFTWIEPVHEKMRLDPLVYDSDIVITHKPEGLHSGRDYRIFLKEFNEGRKLSKHLHHMYAMELFISGSDDDFLAAEPLFSESATDPDRSLDEVKEAACVVVRAARLRGDADKVLKYSLKDLLTEGSSEMCCELGKYFYDKGDFDEAAMWFYNALNETEAILTIQASEEWPKKGYELCAQKLGVALEAE